MLSAINEISVILPDDTLPFADISTLDPLTVAPEEGAVIVANGIGGLMALS